jgi:hypothetical protein
MQNNTTTKPLNQNKMKDKIVQKVVNDFQQRSELGIKKYGVTLDRGDLTTLEWINHFREELMDAILYMTKIEQQLKDGHSNIDSNNSK